MTMGIECSVMFDEYVDGIELSGDILCIQGLDQKETLAYNELVEASIRWMFATELSEPGDKLQFVNVLLVGKSRYLR